MHGVATIYLILVAMVGYDPKDANDSTAPVVFGTEKRAHQNIRDALCLQAHDSVPQFHMSRATSWSWSSLLGFHQTAWMLFCLV